MAGMMAGRMQGQRDARQLLPPGRAVNVGGLVLLLGDRLQRAQDGDHEERIAHPQVDDGDGDERPERVVEEGDRLEVGDERLNDLVDRALLAEEELPDEGSNDAAGGDAPGQDERPAGRRCGPAGWGCSESGPSVRPTTKNRGIQAMT